MKIQDGSLVTIHYEVFRTNGDKLESSYDDSPLEFVFGRGQVIPGLEKALDGKEEGEFLEFTLPPEECYGPVNEDAIQEIPASQFPEDTPAKIGAVYQLLSDSGKTIQFVVKDIKDDMVTIDFNHPLAGESLLFKVEIVSVKEQ